MDRAPGFNPEIFGWPADESRGGAPQKPEDSLFVSQPRLAEAADLAVSFTEGNSEKRRKIPQNLAHRIIDNPRQLADTLDSLAILKEVKAYNSDVLEESLKDNLLKVNKDSFKEFPPSAKQLEVWLGLLADSHLYGDLAEKFLSRLVGFCHSPKAVTDLLYELALAGLRSSNHEVLKKTFEILGYQSPVLPVDSDQAKDSTLGLYDLDDEVVRKAGEIDAAYDYLIAKRFPEILDKKRFLSVDQIVPAAFDEMDLLRDKDRQRFIDLLRFYNLKEDESGVTAVADDFPDDDAFPVNLYKTPGPLRQWLNDLITANIEASGNEKLRAFNFHFPNESFVAANVDDLSTFIRDTLSKPNKTGEVCEDQDCWRTLAHLVPEKLRDEGRLRILAELIRV